MTLVHILRTPACDKWDVQAIIASLDKYELRFIRRRVCWGCEMRLDYAGCGAYGGAPPCSQHARVRRLEKLLATYKPRMSRRKVHGN